MLSKLQENHPKVSFEAFKRQTEQKKAKHVGLFWILSAKWPLKVRLVPCSVLKTERA